MSDLPEILPLFPLEGAILLPRARLPLHVFEPRYVAMVEDALKTDGRLIGMVQPGESGLAQVGGAGRLTAFSETGDGRYMITLTGVSRFRLAGEVESFAPYRRAQVDWAPFAADRDEPASAGQDREAFLGLLTRFLRKRELTTEGEALREADDETLVNALSMLLPFEPGEKQALLESGSLAARAETLVALMEFALRGEAAGGLQ